MPNMISVWFLTCEDLLLFFIVCNSYAIIFEFWTVRKNKHFINITVGFKMCNITIFSDIY